MAARGAKGALAKALRGAAEAGNRSSSPSFFFLGGGGLDVYIYIYIFFFLGVLFVCVFFVIILLFG